MKVVIQIFCSWNDFLFCHWKNFGPAVKYTFREIYEKGFRCVYT